MNETAVAAGAPHGLDDVMIAMDVVDILRHRDDLVRRELGEDQREAELISRLRKIYQDQGIEVSDSVLADGVKALKESRFVYTPPPSGWKRSLLTLWVQRATWAKQGGVVLAVFVVGWAGYHMLVTRPAKLENDKARIEIAETLPRTLRQAHADAVAVATDENAKAKAAVLLADGQRLIQAADRPGAARVIADLAALRDELAREYTLTIVSRPGESTGVWRRPPGNNQARNYYLIVEAIAPDGRKLTLPVRNEETGGIEMADKFGVRVSQRVFEAVALDKRDDGIVQRNRFGAKRRGTLAVEYEMPFEGGFITKW
jgi:uncharacterized protein DUF6384